MAGQALDRGLDHLDLAGQHGVVGAGAPAGDLGAPVRPVKAAMSAAEAVVLPMPMSPVMRHRAPSATARSAATSAPTSSASSASVRVMAGPWERSAVPGPPCAAARRDGRWRRSEPPAG